MRNFLVVLSLFLCFLFLTDDVYAQRGQLPVNFNGPGAKARGMGLTFIAVADDATAIDYNPAGLMQFDSPEISSEIKYSFEDRQHLLPFSSALAQKAKYQDFNDDYFTYSFLGFVYPFERWSFAVSEYTSINFQSKYNDGAYSNNVDMSLYHGALTAAVNITPWLDLGFTGKIGEFNIHQNLSGVKSESDSDVVLGYNAGLMLHPLDSLTLGLVYKSEEDAKIKLYDERFDYEIPQNVGIGANYWFTDNWHVAADVDWTEWSEFDQRCSFNDGADGSLRWERDDVFSFHTGTEILLDLWGDLPTPIRFGYYFLPTNAVEDTEGGVFYDLDDDEDDAHHITTGFGLLWEKLGVDFAVDYSEDKTDLLLSAVFKF